jgi:hypothetical protein
MNKIKCYKLIEAGKFGGFVGHIIPEGKSRTGAIIMIAGDTEQETENKLREAIAEAPPRYHAKYDMAV